MINITEIRIKPAPFSVDRLRAFCSITIDDSFVVKDLKIIEGEKGLFVAMPNRKIMASCPHCRHKNHIQSNYCNNCGQKLDSSASANSETNFYLDIVHPVTTECRDFIQNQIVAAFEKVEGQNSTNAEFIDSVPYRP